jgi:hypothetical protein
MIMQRIIVTIRIHLCTTPLVVLDNAVILYKDSDVVDPRPVRPDQVEDALGDLLGRNPDHGHEVLGGDRPFHEGSGLKRRVQRQPFPVHRITVQWSATRDEVVLTMVNTRIVVVVAMLVAAVKAAAARGGIIGVVSRVHATTVRSQARIPKPYGPLSDSYRPWLEPIMGGCRHWAA